MPFKDREVDAIALRIANEADTVVDEVFIQRKAGCDVEVVEANGDSWLAPEGTPVVSFNEGDGMPTAGTLGERFVAMFPNRKPSEVFDTGFQAALRFITRSAMEPEE